MANDFRHGHLQRLTRLWIESPVYFVTTNVRERRALLANDEVSAIVQEVWQNVEERYGWCVGSYVLMPDHVHFFCAAARPDAEPLRRFVGKWKEWTAKYLHRRHGYHVPFWQEEFFDHVLRSEESYQDKWNYVRNNPVRAGLAATAEAWPYWGMRHQL